MNIFKKSKKTKVLSAMAAAVIGFSMTASSAAALTEVQISAILDLLASFGADQTTIDSTEAALTGQAVPAAPTTGGDCTSYTFATNLELGDTGVDVLNLQKVLNMDTATQVAATGVGSTGEETEYFGGLTKAAVIKFQDKYASEVLTPIGLTAGTGYVGAMTREKLNSMAVCDADDTGDDTGDDADDTEDDTAVTGTLEVVAVNENVVSDGAYVNSGATGVPVLEFTLTGSADTDVTVSSITVNHTGGGATADVVTVYIYEGDTRLTTGRSLSASTKNAVFTGVNVAIPAGGSKTLTVKVDTLTSGGGSTAAPHLFQVASADAIVASNGVVFTGSFPVQGHTYGAILNDVGSITIARAGSQPLAAPKVGQQDVKVAEFLLTAGATEDVTVNGITLYSVGSLSASNISNFELKIMGETDARGTVAAVTSKSLVPLTLTNPIVIEKGGSKTVEVYADISGAARPDDTTIFYVENDADVAAVGTFGWGVSVTRGDYDNVSGAADSSRSTVAGGQVTNAQTGPSAANDIPTNTKDVSLLEWTMTAQSDVEVRAMSIKLDSVGENLMGATAANYTDIKVTDVDTGVIVAGPSDATATANTQTFAFTDVFYLTADSSRNFKVTADIANNDSLDADTITATLVAFGSTDIKSVTNNQYVSSGDIVPSADLAGPTLTIEKASLTATISSAASSQTYIKGSEFIGLSVSLQAGTAGDVRVNSISVQTYVSSSTSGVFDEGTDGGATSTAIILSAGLYDGSTLVGSLKTPTASTAIGNGGVLAFTGLYLDIPANTSKTLDVKVQTSPSATAAQRLKFGIAATGDVSAQDTNGNVITLSNSATNGTTVDNGVVLTIADEGSITAYKASDTIDTETGIVVGGTADATLAEYRLIAENEDLQVTQVKVSLATTDNYANVLQLSLYDGTTKVAGPVDMNSSGSVTFYGTDFVIPKNDENVLSVQAKINTIAAAGASTSGNDIKVILADADFKAKGLDGSNTTLAAGDVTLDINGNSKYVRKSKITIEKQALGASEADVNAMGEHKLYEFKVTSEGATSYIRQFRFDVTLSDGGTNTMTASNWKLYRNGTQYTDVLIGSSFDGSDLLAAAFDETDSASSTQVVVVVGGVGSGDSEDSVAVGSPVTYALYATLAGFGVETDNSSITVELATDAAASTGYAYLDDTDSDTGEAIINLSNGTTGFLGTAANIIWSDGSVTLHSSEVIDNPTGTDTSSSDWLNGYLIKDKPVGSQSVVY